MEYNKCKNWFKELIQDAGLKKKKKKKYFVKIEKMF